MALNLGKLLRLAQLFEQFQPIIKPIVDAVKDLLDGDAPVPPVGGVPAPNPAPIPGNTTPLPPVVPTPPLIFPKKAARVSLRVLMGEKGERFPDQFEKYDNPMKMVKDGDAFNYGCRLWLDASLFDAESTEFFDKDLWASDLDYRGGLYVKNIATGETAYIVGNGGGNAIRTQAPWDQNNAGGVSFGGSAWLDSLGMNCRVVFHDEGEYDVWFMIGGVESNHLKIRVS